jgi:ATP-dependent Clp protease ATP-binding subunit ClpB
MTNTVIPLSSEVQTAIKTAQAKAREYTQATFTPGHLLWGLLQEDVGLHSLLRDLDKEIPKLRSWAEFRITNHLKSSRIVEHPQGDERTQATLKEADKIRGRNLEPEILPVHVLEALCTPEVAYAADQLKRLPIALIELQGAKDSASLIGEAMGNNGKTSNGSATPKSSKAQLAKALDKYCDDLTAKARQGRVDPVIGRDKELKQLVEILGKRISPNVLIVGEPGVGKTAVVGGLALNILENKVPDRLKEASIFELDVSGRLVAGAFKGEVEERLKDVLKAIKEFGKAILFIDEIHALLDENGSIGSGAVNLLKPELARGELTVIGATTQAEYRKFIESDEAFKRRFTILKVDEPTEDLAAQMLVGLVSRFETHHDLAVEKEAIPESVRLAKRYLADKNLPASALELLDLTLSSVRVMNDTSKQELDAIEKEYAALEKEAPLYESQLKVLDASLKNRLSHILMGRLEDGEEQALSFTEKITKLKDWSAETKTEIKREDVGAMAAYLTGIPMGKIQSKEQEQLLQMESLFRKKVVGQDHALVEVGQALRRSRAGLKEANKPAAVFFFLGPTGTGKTELAKTIAELLFNDGSALLRFDMSEFKEEHSAALLYGSPPGYVGYKEGGLLVNKIRQKPYSVVLFDEIEKAHSSVFDIFLQILDEGVVHDKLDKKGDFSNAVVIFTSNIGSEQIMQSFDKGVIPDRDTLREIINSTKRFRPEFLGRRMNIIPFSPITEGVALNILDIHLRSFMKILKLQNIQLEATEGARKELVKSGFSPQYGARPLKDTIEDRLATAMANKIIAGEIPKGSHVKVDWDEAKGDFAWEVNS